VPGRDNGRPERDGLVEVMAAQRAAIARANQHRLTDIQHRVLLAVFALISSWSRLEDVVYVAQVATHAGLEPDADGDHRSVRRAIARLNELGVIEWEPGRGSGKRSTLRLPEAAHERAELKPDNSEPKTGHPGCPPTEKDREEEQVLQGRQQAVRGGCLPASLNNVNDEVVSEQSPDETTVEGSGVGDGGADRERSPDNRRSRFDELLDRFKKLRLNVSTVALVRQEFAEWPGGVVDVMEIALERGGDPCRFLSYLLREGEHRVAEVRELPVAKPKPPPRPAPRITTECMGCNKERVCVDGGGRVLCDNCRFDLEPAVATETEFDDGLDHELVELVDAVAGSLGTIS